MAFKGWPQQEDDPLTRQTTPAEILQGILPAPRNFSDWFERTMGSSSPGMGVLSGVGKALSQFDPGIMPSPTAVVGATPRAAEVVSKGLESFSRPFRNVINSAIERGGIKGQKSSYSKYEPVEDVPFFLVKNADELSQQLLTTETALDMLRDFEQGKVLGQVSLPLKKYQRKGDLPISAVLERALPYRTDVHELAHVGFPKLRGTTVEALGRSFKKRGDEIADDLIASGNLSGEVANYLDRIQLSSAYSNKGRFEHAVNEILARLLQGYARPTGPERHLLSPEGRMMADDLFKLLSAGGP